MTNSSSNSVKSLKVLLLCDYNANTAGTVIEHIESFSKFSRHRIHKINAIGNIPPNINLNSYDAVVIHYSIIVSYDNYLNKIDRERLRTYQGLKIVFIQDDYRWIYKTLAALDYIKANIIFGLVPQAKIDQVYLKNLLPTVRRRETVLAGYVPESLIGFPRKKFHERTLDVAYRARKVPSWIGKHTLQKWQIADNFLKDARHYQLSCDISWREEDRIYGNKWIDFLSNSKAVLGTESGSSICDFTGQIQNNVEKHLEKYPEASFEELSELYFKNEDGKIIINIISPRCFEAATLGTLMILYEGYYSGVLRPYQHYVPLARDHSNMDEVVQYLYDVNKWQEITTNAHQEIALNPEFHFSGMIKFFDHVLDEEIRHHHIPSIIPFHTINNKIKRLLIIFWKREANYLKHMIRFSIQRIASLQKRGFKLFKMIKILSCRFRYWTIAGRIIFARISLREKRNILTDFSLLIEIFTCLSKKEYIFLPLFKEKRQLLINIYPPYKIPEQFIEHQSREEVLRQIYNKDLKSIIYQINDYWNICFNMKFPVNGEFPYLCNFFNKKPGILVYLLFANNEISKKITGKY